MGFANRGGVEIFAHEFPSPATCWRRLKLWEETVSGSMHGEHCSARSMSKAC